MSKIKGREIHLRYLVKSAVAQRYYESFNMSYDTEAARKRFNQDYIDLERLVEVMRIVSEEEMSIVKQQQDESKGD